MLTYSKLWHDDVRPPPLPESDNHPQEWYWARTNKEAIAYLLHCDKTGEPCVEASLDHDMGAEPDDDIDALIARGKSPDGDGTDLAYVMYYLKIVPPKVTIHSWNDIGAERMAAILRAADAEVIIAPYQHYSDETHAKMFKTWPK